MSEETRKREDYYEPEQQVIPLSSSAEHRGGASEFALAAETSRAPRPGLLAVDVLSSVVPEATVSVNPYKVLFEYTRFLVNRIGEQQQDTAKEARALYQTVQVSVESSTTSWDPSFVASIVEILTSHPALETQRTDKGLNTVLEKLQRILPLDSGNRLAAPKQTTPADSTTYMSSFVSGIADRMSDQGGISQILAELGPSTTRSASTLRDVLADVARTSGPLNDAGLASLVYFFSNKTPEQQQQQENTGSVVGLSSALLGSIVPGRGQDVNVWNLEIVAQVLAQDYATADWTAVAHKWDTAQFVIKDTAQFQALLDLYRAGAKSTPPLNAFTCPWRNTAGQLSVLEAMMAVRPSVFMVPLNEEELADAATGPPPGPTSALNPQCWASGQVLQRLLQLSDVPSLYRRVRDLFVRCLLSCPEVLLCSLVRLQLRVANAATQQGGEDLVSIGMQIKTELMRELIPLFFRPNSHHRVQNGQAALRRLYAISPTTVMAACFEAWRSASQEGAQVRLATIIHIINIARLLPSPQEAVASLLSGSRDAEYSISVAFVMADNDYLQLQPWLGEKLSAKASVATFAVSLVSYLRKTYTTAGPKADKNHGNTPLVSLENVATSLQLLQSLDQGILAQTVTGLDRSISAGPTLGENVRSLTEACLSTHPSLRGTVTVKNLQPAPAARPGGGSNASSDDVEEMATAYFQKIYTSEQSIGEVVEMLKRFKTSGNSKENEIFACMVHNLYDEYRFFAKYPEKELRITGILFGALIQEQLVSSITLGIALRYVLEALRKPPSPPNATTSSGKMFKFGMFALEQFKGRLHEWPQYCSHIVQIPHLKEGYAKLVAEIEQEMTKSQSRTTPATQTSGPAVASDSSIGANSSQGGDSVPDPVFASAKLEPARVAEFGPGLGRSVTEGTDDERDFEAPPDATLDKVQFLVNNLAPSNVEKKAAELKVMLDPKYFGWLGHFLVVKRISTQANFHSLYLSFLDNLGEYGKGLVEAILSSVYHNIGKLLRSPKITTSSSERSYLKNLGIWLGQITLSRNRPIKQIMLDCKELLLQGYETGKLIAVAPFLAKTLEGAKASIIFRPPNPWVMGLLTVFRSVYNVEGLKMNIKFEVEVLCKNLGIKLEDIPLRRTVLAGRIAPVKERNPDFNIKSAQKAANASRPAVASPEAQTLGITLPPGDESGRSTPTGTDQQDTVIPNLAAYVTVNTSLPQLLQSQPGSALANLNTASLKRWVPIAVDRAIREIIQPVVERSVTIACITTKEIVTKDFAMESDETKMRKAGQLMVANLAGSLALVTCREPLRSSVSSHLRQLLSSNLGRADSLGEQEQNIIEQCVQICATDNLELGCKLIEKAATEKAVRDVDEALSAAMAARRKHREQTGQPFYDMSIFSNGNQRYPAALPDQLRPKPGGLQAEHFQLYESFQRMSRQNQAQAAAVAPGSGASGIASMRGPPSSSADEAEGALGPKQGASQQFGTESLAAITSKLDQAVTGLLSAAGTRAREIKLAMLPADHQIRQLLGAVKQVMPNSNPSGGISRPLTTPEQELILGFSQGIFKRLYELSLTEPLRLEALVTVLENINEHCPKLGKDMGTWATYAPTNTEPQRRLHRTVLLLLVRSRLLAVHDLDTFLAARADHGRNHVWVEFSLVFIRTAFLELISSPADFPKLIDLMTRIADGRSQATPQVAQAVRKPILQMLEETRGGGQHDQQNAVPCAVASASGSASVTGDTPISDSSSLSAESLAKLAHAPQTIAESTDMFARSDPQAAQQQVTTLLESWIRLQNEASGNEKALVQYLQVLQQWGFGKVEEQTERFLRLSTLIVVDAVLKSAGPRGNAARSTLNYGAVDLYCRLLQVLFRHMNSGGSPDQMNAQRLAMLNKILGSLVRSMMWHNKKTESTGRSWDQRPFYRLFMNLVIDLNKPDPIFEPIRLGMLSVFGSAFHVCQPLAMPGFAFSWLELVSHRHFMPNVLSIPKNAGWHIAHQLMIDQFLFLEPYLKRVELTVPIKKLYEGTLRVLLVLLHDFPSFLTSYHLSFCNVIPDNCVQLRNIVLSATPKGMTTPDPFTPNLKIDLLPETSQSPAILSHVLGPIEGMQGHLDAYLKESHRNLSGLLPLLYTNGTTEVDASKANSLVVYVGAHALARLQSSQISLSRTPDIELFQKLMEFDDKGRYICLNSIANQLRFPSSHTHYFSCVMLYIFSESKSVAVKEQVTRVLLERLIVHRPHPWGLLITFIELIKNQKYGFWTFPFTRCATEIEKVFESVARSCMPPGAQRSALVGGDDQ